MTTANTQQEIDRLLALSERLTALFDASVQNQQGIFDILRDLAFRVQDLEATVYGERKGGKHETTPDAMPTP